MSHIQATRGMTREETANFSFEEMRALGFCGKLMADKIYRCRNWAGARTDHPGFGACKYHGGNRETERMASAKAEVAKQSATLKVEIEPTEALRQSLYMAAGAVAYCQLQIRALEEEEAELSYDDHGYHANAKSRMLSTWMALYAQERDRMTVVAKECLKANISERHVRAIEHRASVLGDALGEALAEVDLDPATASKLVRALRSALARKVSLEAQVDGGGAPSSLLPTVVGRARMAKAEEARAALPSEPVEGLDVD